MKLVNPSRTLIQSTFYGENQVLSLLFLFYIHSLISSTPLPVSCTCKKKKKKDRKKNDAVNGSGLSTTSNTEGLNYMTITMYFMTKRVHTD